MIKIAVALCGENLAAHFGRAERFATFLFPDECPGGFRDREGKADAIVPAPHLSHEHGRIAEHDHGHGSHHSAIVRALEGCRAVIAGGMGHRVAAALAQAGIEPVVAAENGAPEVLARRLIEGKLCRGKIHRCCHGD